MTGEGNDDIAGGGGARAAMFMLIARAAIVCATVVGLPVAGWMLNRAVESMDRISTKVDALREQSLETNGTVKLIQQSQDMQNRTIADHEARVRMLESASRNNPIRN